ncbi:MAG: hypothetical protein ACXWCY_14035 [Burkholderiales bacterium]
MIIRTTVLAAMLAIAAVPAQALVTASQNGIGYAAGGIGSDEMQQLQAREKDFNLKLVFTLVEGNYLSDVAVHVKDKSGKTVLALDAAGPLLLTKLLRGSYVVDATYLGKTLTRKVAVRDRLRTEYLRWPSNPETDFPGPKETER